MRGTLRKIICISVCLLMIVASLPATESKADVIPIPKNFKKHGIIYHVEKKLKGNFGEVSVIGIDDEAVGEDLNNIVIPELLMKNQIVWNVKFIAPFAFSQRHDLKSVVISGGIEEIGTGAFYECTGLTDISISDTVNKIGTYAFSGCDKLKNIKISEENVNFSASNGLLLSKDGTTIISAPGATGEYWILKGITTIGPAAFDSNAGITDVWLSTTVTSIEEGAFYNCKNLKSINLKKVEHIGKEAFFGCGLESINIPETVSKIEDNPFAFCDSLKEITVSNENSKYKAFDNMLFNSSGKKLICATTADNNTEFPAKVTTVGAYAFAGNKRMEEITFPKKIKKIDECAFMLCTSLKKVRFLSRKVDFADIKDPGSGAFYNTTVNLIVEFPYSEESFTEGSPEYAIKAHCPDGVLITNY